MNRKIGIILMSILLMIVGSALLVQATSTSTINVGSPSYNDGTNNFITSDTPIDFTLTWTATENYFKYIIDGTYYTINPPIGPLQPVTPVYLSGDGPHTIEYRTAETSPIYYEPLNTWTCTLDDIDPVIVDATPNIGDYIKGTYTIQVETYDVDSGIDYVRMNLYDSSGMVDGWYLNHVSGDIYEADVDFSVYPDGDYYFKIGVRDNVNNGEYAQINPIHIDNTKPTITSLLEPTPGNCAKNSFNVKCTAADNPGGSGVEKVRATFEGTQYWLTETSPGVWEGIIDTTTVSDGTYDIVLQPVDAADNWGNWGWKKYVDIITIDHTKPTVTMIFPYKDDCLNGDFTMECMVTDANTVDRVIMKIFTSGGTKVFQQNADYNPVSCTWKKDVDSSLLADGEYYITIHPKDCAGNWGWHKENPIYIDNSAPTVTYDIQKIYYNRPQRITTLYGDDHGACGGTSGYYIHYMANTFPYFGWQTGSLNEDIEIAGATIIWYYTEDTLGNIGSTYVLYTK